MHLVSGENDASSSHKYYFVCPSYGFISPILSIIESTTSHHPEITIFVIDEQMRLFWQHLIIEKDLDWKLIQLNATVPGRFRNVRSWLNVRFIVKRLYEDHFRSICHSSFYCCGSANNLVLFSLIKRIAKNNHVIFLDLSSITFPKLYSLKSFIVLIHTWIFYRLDVSIRNIAGQPGVFLSEGFFAKHNIQRCQFEYHYDERLLQKYNPVCGSYTQGKRVLWLDDDSLTYTEKLRDDIHTFLRSLKCIIDTHFEKKEILFKRHPNPGFQSTGFQTIYSDYDEYPSYLSADFIISNGHIEVMLGNLSAVLSTAAKNSSILTISYAKLIPYEDEHYKRCLIDLRIRESNQKVIFIESLEELESLLHNQHTRG